jgi:membrane protein YdbS with pleckstrin-like domain
MSYIEKNLLPGETINYRATRHWIALSIPVALALFFFVCAVMRAFEYFSQSDSDSNLAVGLGVYPLLLGCLLLVFAYIRLKAIEMAVTSRRVIAKRGFLHTRSIDIPLAKIESILVNQAPMGRLLDYGTVTIRGVAGTPEHFSLIRHPLEFRNQVHAVIEPA